MRPFAIGDSLPIQHQLASGATNKFVRAYMYDSTGVQWGVFELVHVARGLYRNDDIVMPNLKFFMVQYVIYDDDGFSLPLTPESNGNYTDVFCLDSIQKLVENADTADLEVLDSGLVDLSVDPVAYANLETTDGNIDICVEGDRGVDLSAGDTDEIELTTECH